MFILFKKAIFSITLNSALFFLLIIGIQNSTNRTTVNLLIGETVSLPVGFVVGMSFISGSISGNLLTLNFRRRKLD